MTLFDAYYVTLERHLLLIVRCTSSNNTLTTWHQSPAKNLFSSMALTIHCPSDPRFSSRASKRRSVGHFARRNFHATRTRENRVLFVPQRESTQPLRDATALVRRRAYGRTEPGKSTLQARNSVYCRLLSRETESQAVVCERLLFVCGPVWNLRVVQGLIFVCGADERFLRQFQPDGRLTIEWRLYFLTGSPVEFVRVDGFSFFQNDVSMLLL